MPNLVKEFRVEASPPPPPPHLTKVKITPRKIGFRFRLANRCSIYFALVSLLILVTLVCSKNPALLFFFLILQTIKSIDKFCRC